MAAWGVAVDSSPGSPRSEDLEDEWAIEAESRAMQDEEPEPEPESGDEGQQPRHTRSGVRRSSAVRDDDEEEEAERRRRQ